MLESLLPPSSATVIVTLFVLHVVALVGLTVIVGFVVSLLIIMLETSDITLFASVALK